jgi:hypothetical protein
MITCDISVQNVIITSNTITCSRGSYPEPRPSGEVTVVGVTAVHWIYVRNSNARIHFQDVSIENMHPLQVFQSNLSLDFLGRNRLAANVFDFPGIECALRSNITFHSQRLASSLIVEGGPRGPGIGSAGHDVCATLRFANGTVIARGAVGIGTGATDGQAATIENIVIESANVTATGSIGPGIGSGESNYDGSLSVTSFVMRGGYLTATGGSNAGAIGAGPIRRPLGSDLGSVSITGGRVNARGSRFGDSRTLNLESVDLTLNCECQTTCVSSQTVVMRNVTLKGFVKCPRSFSRPPLYNGHSNISIMYTVPSVAEDMIGLPLIHFGEVSLPVLTVYELTFSEYPWRRVVTYDSDEYRGLMVSLDAPRPVQVTYTSRAGNGTLAHGGDTPFFVGLSEAYWPYVEPLKPRTAFPLPTVRPLPTQRPRSPTKAATARPVETATEEPPPASAVPTPLPTPTPSPYRSSTRYRAVSKSPSRTATRLAQTELPEPPVDTVTSPEPMTDVWEPTPSRSASHPRTLSRSPTATKAASQTPTPPASEIATSVATESHEVYISEAATTSSRATVAPWRTSDWRESADAGGGGTTGGIKTGTIATVTVVLAVVILVVPIVLYCWRSNGGGGGGDMELSPRSGALCDGMDLSSEVGSGTIQEVTVKTLVNSRFLRSRLTPQGAVGPV